MQLLQIEYRLLTGSFAPQVQIMLSCRPESSKSGQQPDSCPQHGKSSQLIAFSLFVVCVVLDTYYRYNSTDCQPINKSLFAVRLSFLSRSSTLSFGSFVFMDTGACYVAPVSDSNLTLIDLNDQSVACYFFLRWCVHNVYRYKSTD